MIFLHELLNNLTILQISDKKKVENLATNTIS